MILYNITVNIEKSVELEWLAWMKNVHMQEVMDTGMFIDSKIFVVLNEEPNSGTSYSIQYFAKSLNEVETYLEKFAPALREVHNEKYGGNFVAFRTVLELV